ncbi:hypothetical protein M0812_14549 [Anaeramoeba flamelloides]|uniref:Uncharacterized protein n=1 Tax=Anaeramoeba flamelloides TaxID=1746091 RepID=A0AAV7ZI18_9EUKA|nr:hypothetical protein M0812_14549 [Anaeramoeba flamelloides]
MTLVLKVQDVDLKRKVNNNGVTSYSFSDNSGLSSTDAFNLLFMAIKNSQQKKEEKKKQQEQEEEEEEQKEK